MTIPAKTLLETEDVRVRIMTLLPGERTGLHHHSEVIDQMVCLSGTITVTCRRPDQSVMLSPGEHCEVEVMRSHQVANPSLAEEARYLLIQGVGKYDFLADQEKDLS